jgi:hypothetical protein
MQKIFLVFLRIYSFFLLFHVDLSRCILIVQTFISPMPGFALLVIDEHAPVLLPWHICD